MSSRIAKRFRELKSYGKKALIPYISCGDPSLQFTEKLVLELQRAGADMIELGIPYSDPVADGPTIQKASQRALAGGVTIDKIFNLVYRVRLEVKIPLIFMTYYNSVFRYGLERFVSKAAEAGIDGLIVPDLPPEEAKDLKELTDQYNLDLIFLAAPTSTAHRLKKIAALARGFVYCVSVTGVTGSRKEFDRSLENFLANMRVETSLPLAVGFGISGPETAKRAAAYADGIIVGSSLIERIEQNLDLVSSNPKHVVDEVCAYLRSLREAIDEHR